MIETVITGGYGSFGTIALVVTMGYGINSGPVMADVNPLEFIYEAPTVYI